MFTTLGLKSYKAYGAPEFWKFSTSQISKAGPRGYKYGYGMNKMGRSYHNYNSVSKETNIN